MMTLLDFLRWQITVPDGSAEKTAEFREPPFRVLERDERICRGDFVNFASGEGRVGYWFIVAADYANAGGEATSIRAKAKHLFGTDSASEVVVTRCRYNGDFRELIPPTVMSFLEKEGWEEYVRIFLRTKTSLPPAPPSVLGPGKQEDFFRWMSETSKGKEHHMIANMLLFPDLVSTYGGDMLLAVYGGFARNVTARLMPTASPTIRRPTMATAATATPDMWTTGNSYDVRRDTTAYGRCSFYESRSYSLRFGTQQIPFDVLNDGPDGIHEYLCELLNGRAPDIGDMDYDNFDVDDEETTDSDIPSDRIFEEYLDWLDSNDREEEAERLREEYDV